MVRHRGHRASRAISRRTLRAIANAMIGRRRFFDALFAAGVHCCDVDPVAVMRAIANRFGLPPAACYTCQRWIAIGDRRPRNQPSGTMFDSGCRFCRPDEDDLEVERRWLGAEVQ